MKVFGLVEPGNLAQAHALRIQALLDLGIVLNLGEIGSHSFLRRSIEFWRQRYCLRRSSEYGLVSCGAIESWDAQKARRKAGQDERSPSSHRTCSSTTSELQKNG